MIAVEPVPIIDVYYYLSKVILRLRQKAAQTPGFGDLSAVVACDKYKIKSQNDTVALAEAKVCLHQ